MIRRRDNAWGALTTLSGDIGARIRDINARANQDAEFHQRLNNDPVAVLTAEGLPTEATQAVLDFDPTQAPSDVEAYMRRADGTCWDITWSSHCPGSCYVTIIQHPVWRARDRR